MIDAAETNLADHPAAIAWRRLVPASIEPERIDVLQGRRDSTVYRLHGVGPGGSAVIAKRCSLKSAVIEPTIYQDVLPRLPLSSLRCYGIVEVLKPEANPQCWLFLEDAGSEIYSDTNAEHRALAARWLASLHSCAASSDAAKSLPDRGPDHFLSELQVAVSRIEQNLNNSLLTDDDRRALRTLLLQCAQLQTKWDEVVDLCHGIPATLVHGDMAEKNIRVRTGPEGNRLMVMDWETAGWGIPASDLEFIGHSANPDLQVYLAVVQQGWPWIDQTKLRDLVAAGRIFRLIAAIGWASESLATHWVEKAMRNIRLYQTWLADSIRALK